MIRLLPLLLLLLLLACRVSLSPLQNKVAVGQEPYLALQAAGESGRDDIYVVRPDDGTVVPLTYTRWGEAHPALSPDGVMLAFVRYSIDETELRVVVMNLLNGNERVVWGPVGEAISGLGWADAGLIAAATASGPLLLTAPPAAPRAIRPVGDEAARADSSLHVLLGDPPFARVVECENADELCVLTANGVSQPLQAGASVPLRWGPDSLAYLLGETIEIRPLGPGRSRSLTAEPPLAGIENGSYFPGPPLMGAGLAMASQAAARLSVIAGLSGGQMP